MNTARNFMSPTIRIMILCLFCTLIAQAQQTENRLLKKAFVAPVEPAPLEITNLKVNGNSINFDQPFQAGDEWVKGLTFDVKNTSGKVITHFKIGLRLHNPDNNQRAMANMVFHGRNTGLPNIEPTVRVGAGEVIQAAYEDKRYNQFKQMQERISLNKITTIELSIDMVVFDDDTMWRLGNLLRRDPANPLRWNIVSNPRPQQ